ncbi:MAG: diguanylate cyclase [Proteobacteria bacterium]|nr:diguanylate cyclase [Pseudomonadota bacterium]
MEHEDLIFFLQNVGKDPSRLIFDDELTGIRNRRFLNHYFEQKVDWEAVEEKPVSLLMMDLDYFKQINDMYGHAGGDKALVYVAQLLKEVAGEQGIPIRYAGDEFMILLPGTSKDDSIILGKRIIDVFHERPCKGPEVGGDLYLTISIGVACAPEDANNGKSLVEKADSALYHAKDSGRDCLANAGEIAPETVFTKTALHYLGAGRIAGRKAQLAEVTAALKGFKLRQSQFLIVEGSPGLGKSTFLETVHRSLDQTRIKRVKVPGIPQELFRPYYLAASVLMGLMNLEEDRGMRILDSLTPREMACLGQILPWLGGSEQEEVEFENESAKREAIFNTILHFIPRLLGFQPLILLVDDLHYADEATLLFFRMLLLRKEVPVFICATSADTRQMDLETGPMERFLSSYGKELGIRRSRLTALGIQDIADHMKAVFPGIELPEGFAKAMADTSQGNPLFLAEILPKLVYDKRICFSGNNWVVEPLEEGYLPRSLEEIIRQKVATLDEEGLKLLDHASTFGENVSLSMLTGSTETMEARVLEFLDQAVAQNLVSVDFQMNDERLRFLGKEIQQIIYQNIGDDRKEELHEHIGNYQETLYEKQLVPSAAILAYHFKRSANLEKASKYEKLQAEHNAIVFNVREALDYTGERLGEEPLADVPLHPDSLTHLPDLLRTFLVAVRNTRLYPPGSQLTANAVHALWEAVNKILKKNEVVGLGVERKELLANNEPVQVQEFKGVAESFITFMNRYELRALAFRRGLGEQELRRMLEAVAGVDPKAIGKDFWQVFQAEYNLVGVIPMQVRYARLTDDDTPPETFLEEEDGNVASMTQAAVGVHGLQDLDMEDQRLAALAVRSMLGAASKLKLYPPDGPVASSSLEQFTVALMDFLGRKSVLTLTRVENNILLNGVRPDPTIFEKITVPLLKFMKGSGLKSISFLPKLSRKEVVDLFTMAGQQPSDADQSPFWWEFAAEKGIEGILLNEALYGIITQEGRASEPEPSPPEEEPEEPERPEDEDPESLANRIRDLFLKGDENKVLEILGRLFAEYGRSEPERKKEILEMVQVMAEMPELAAASRLLRILADPLLGAMIGETEPLAMEKLADTLLSITEQFILLGEYPLASWVLGFMDRKRQEVEGVKEEKSRLLARVLKKELSPGVRNLVMEDAANPDPARHQKALQLLASQGSENASALIEVVKQASELRVRQIAASLLKKQGGLAVDAFRRDLVTEGSVDLRVRMLEVGDTVTRDLRTELSYGLGDENLRVRRAALGLAERLNTRFVAELLLEYAQSHDSQVAADAIRLLGRLKIREAVEIVGNALENREDPEVQTACCQALGQIGDPGATRSLAKALEHRSFFTGKLKHNPTVRAAAAFALAQMNQPETIALLASFDEDEDARIRQLARKARTVAGQEPGKKKGRK